MSNLFQGASDYGYYGKTGKYPINKALPVKKCCEHAYIKCEYDDTPGWRETWYEIRCDKCNLIASNNTIIENAIKEWNIKVYKHLGIDPPKPKVYDYKNDPFLKKMEEELSWMKLVKV